MEVVVPAPRGRPKTLYILFLRKANETLQERFNDNASILAFRGEK